jgi:hypothetical protein
MGAADDFDGWDDRKEFIGSNNSFGILSRLNPLLF